MRAIGVIDQKLKKAVRVVEVALWRSMPPLRILLHACRCQTELRTDAPAIRESLESVSTFYGPTGNTVETRRSLRAGIESESLRLANVFIDAFSGIEQVGWSCAQRVTPVFT